MSEEQLGTNVPESKWLAIAKSFRTSVGTVKNVTPASRIAAAKKSMLEDQHYGFRLAFNWIRALLKSGDTDGKLYSVNDEFIVSFIKDTEIDAITEMLDIMYERVRKYIEAQFPPVQVREDNTTEEAVLVEKLIAAKRAGDKDLIRELTESLVH